MSEMQKKIGVTDFVEEIECVTKYPNFENVATVITQHGLYGFFTVQRETISVRCYLSRPVWYI